MTTTPAPVDSSSFCRRRSFCCAFAVRFCLGYPSTIHLVIGQREGSRRAADVLVVQLRWANVRREQKKIPMRKREIVGPIIKGLPLYVGGLRLPPILLNFGWPSTQLMICEEGVWLGPSFFVFSPFVPRRAFRYDDLAEVKAVGLSQPGIGIRFRSQSSGSWAVFWVTRRAIRDSILENLEPYCNCVNQVPVRLGLQGFLDPGPRTIP